jgi:glycosyltransferase involved in cell wall biosynthesis
MDQKISPKSHAVNAGSRTDIRNASQKKNQKEPAISLCMIVKNEADCLSRCLESTKDYVDEIIIVDTGSTDETVRIAKSFGAKIYHHPWENDFSRHRNQSLSYASGDWILQLDADEALTAGSGQMIRDTIRKDAADYYYCQFYDMDRQGIIKGVCNLIRLFRNRMGMEFIHKVHNQLQVNGEGSFSKIRVKHYGYHLSKEKMEAKHVRTTTLLKKAIEINPEDGYSLHQLAASYSMKKDYSKVIEYGEKAADVLREKDIGYAYHVSNFYLLAVAHYNLNEMESARRICLEAEELFSGHLDISHILSAIYFKQKSFEKCKKISLRYLNTYRQLQDNPSKIGSGVCYCFCPSMRSNIYMGLACTCFIEQDYQNADIYFRKAFEDSDRQMENAENIYRFYIEQHMHEKALRWLTTAYEVGCSQGKISDILQDQPALYLEICDSYLQQDAFDAAQRCLHHVPDKQLGLNEQLQKRLLQIRIYWANNAIEDLLKELEILLPMLDFQTDRCLNSFDDLGKIFYEVAAVFTKQQQWSLAEPTLKLATRIAPALFEPETFQQHLAVGAGC